MIRKSHKINGKLREKDANIFKHVSSVSDPDPVGSGSTSGNVDPDPGSKNKS